MPYKKKESVFSKALKKQETAQRNKVEFSDELMPVAEKTNTKIESDFKKTSAKAPKPAKSPKNRQGSLVWRIITIVSIILVISAGGVYGYFSLNNYETEVKHKESNVLSTMDRVIIPEGHFNTAASYDFTYLKQMKASKVTPGVDLYADPNATAEQLNAQVDKIIENMLKLEFNSIIVDTKMGDSVIYGSSTLKKTGVDLLDIITKKAKDAGLNVVAVFNATGVAVADGTVMKDYLSSADKLTLNDAVSELAGQYELDSILLDNYYVKRDADAYKKFVEYGGIGNFNDWIYLNTQTTIKGISNAVANTVNSMPTGLLIKDVWADDTVNPAGTKTVSEFSALNDGHVDTKKLIEEKAVQFASVEIKTSLYDKNQPFETISKWWADICKASDTPMYITHHAENADSKELAGWDGTDQLARQLATALDLPSYHGSAYTGLDSMMKNMETSTEYLLKVYNDSYDLGALFQDLEISLPQKKSFVTYEENVQFRGKFDPNQEVILNGEKVVPSEKGGFSVWVPLKVGKNQVILEHKGQKAVFNIERKVIIFKEWKPQGNMKVSGSSQIEFNVLAYKDSQITATINGTTVKLEEGGGVDNPLDSNYVNYVGFYTVPKATAKEQSIGGITFNGTYQGHKESQKGSNITIDKLPDEVDPDEATGQVMQHAIVNTTYAYTYPFNTTPGYPQGISYQLPLGTQDIVQSINGDFVNLRSGKTVKMKDVSLTDIPFVGNNTISEFTAGVEGDDTVIRLTMGWKAPFSITPDPYPTDTSQIGKNYNFAANSVTILLDYATTHSKDNFVDSMSSSPLFSGMSAERVKNAERNIWQYKITLPLQQTGKYYGVHAQYEGNTLVFRFNHGGQLAGKTIMVDVGHGGKDNGTMAGRDVLEKDVNLMMANKLKAALEAHGANVVMSRTTDETISDDTRLERFYAAQPDMVLAVHHNSVGANAQPNGVETYYNTPFSQPLAAAVQAQLGQHLNNRGWKFYNFFQIRGKQYPGILIEYAFLSNPSDEALALDPAHQEKMANATAQGVANYFS